MTPEERLDRIEATFDRASRLYEKMNLRHAGIRTLYRQGVNRIEEIAERMDRQDELIAALIDSQLRTEESLRRFEKTASESSQRMEKAVADLSQTVKAFIEAQQK